MRTPELRIAIIAHNLRSGGGISVATNIIRALLKLHPNWSYLVLAPDLSEYRDIAPTALATIEHFRHRSYLQRIIFDEIHLPRRLRAYNPDLIFSLGNIPVRGVRASQALLLHNPNILYPEVRIPNQPIGIQLAYLATKAQLRRGLHDVNIVLCQTETMARRFQRHFAYDGPVAIMPNAISDEVVISSTNTGLAPPRLPKRSFNLLILTRYYAHKNIEAVIACFDHYRQSLHDVGVIITVAPDQHPNAARLLHAIHQKGLEDAIINVGPLRQTELPAYYRAVDAVLLPTLLESFSGAYIEAMAFQKPIITSDRDFAHETCGDAAIYFNPESPESMAQAILRLKNEPLLRKSLADAGTRKRQGMIRTWDEVVATTLTEIQRIVAPPRLP